MSWFKKSEIFEFSNNPRTINEARRLYEQGDEMVRYHVVYELSNLGDIETVEHAYKYDSSELVRNMAKKCIEKTSHGFTTSLLNEMRVLVAKAVKELESLKGTADENSATRRIKVLNQLIAAIPSVFDKEIEHLDYIRGQELTAPLEVRSLDHLIHSVKITGYTLRENY